ncbi:MAG: hypothetical protein HC802_03810 [Caldilineaceae bacterium]|nr:hypothetical protein [Caldilineaceae bacterium]
MWLNAASPDLGSHSRAFALGELHAFQNKMSNGRLTEAVCQLCSDECEFWSSPELSATLQSYFAWAGHSNRLKQQIYGRVGSFNLNLYATLMENPAPICWSILARTCGGSVANCGQNGNGDRCDHF